MYPTLAICFQFYRPRLPEPTFNPWNILDGITYLISSNEVGVVYSRARLHRSHILLEFLLQVKVDDFSAHHGLREIQGADVPAVDHYDNIISLVVGFCLYFSSKTFFSFGKYSYNSSYFGLSRRVPYQIFSD